jgi:hypothetical protein
MDWQNISGFYLNRIPHAATLEGAILMGRESNQSGRYLLYVHGKKKVYLDDNSKLSNLFHDINYNKVKHQLNSIWIYLPDVRKGTGTVRYKISSTMPTGVPDVEDYRHLESFGAF